MTEREQYLFNASAWTHHHPYVDTPHPHIESPIEDYELYPGWQIIIMITSQCNTRCSHCYLPFQGSFEPRKLNELIKHFQNLGYNVYLNGAEPLLNKDYLQSIKIADQKIIMTNGLVLCNEPSYIYDIRDAGIETIGISYHFDIHAKFSKVPLRLAQTALDITQSAGVNARVMTTITKHYLEEIPRYCAWCVEHGYPEIRFTNFMSQGRAKELDRDLILTAEDRKRYFEIISAERAKYPKEKLTITSCGSFGACSPNMSCMAVHDFVVLTPDLKVYPCFFQTQPGMECGFYDEKTGTIFTKIGCAPSRHDCGCLHIFND